jgi:hypothetical protein
MHANSVYHKLTTYLFAMLLRVAGLADLLMICRIPATAFRRSHGRLPRIFDHFVPPYPLTLRRVARRAYSAAIRFSHCFALRQTHGEKGTKQAPTACECVNTCSRKKYNGLAIQRGENAEAGDTIGDRASNTPGAAGLTGLNACI